MTTRKNERGEHVVQIILTCPGRIPQVVRCYNLLVHSAVTTITHLVAPLHLVTRLLIVLRNLVALGRASSGQPFSSAFSHHPCALRYVGQLYSRFLVLVLIST